MFFDPRAYRSPETRSEVKAAAKVLFGLSVLFALSAAAGVIASIIGSQPDLLLLAGVLIFVAILCGSAGAYNVYYTRRMQHASFMALALAHPNKTVAFIMLAISGTVVAGAYLLGAFE